MLPTLKDGKVYNMIMTTDSEIVVGDIVVFHLDGMNICHRVIKVIRSRSGEVFLKTKGDNCLEPDPYAITIGMVIGKIIL